MTDRHSLNRANTPLLLRLWRPLLVGWALVSLTLWIGLPADALLRLTPLTCGLLLTSVGITLLVVLWSASEDHRHIPGFFTMLFSALAAPVAALAFGVESAALLARHPETQLAGLLWTICSMGAVLTLVVSRFLCAMVHDRRRAPAGKFHVASSGQPALPSEGGKRRRSQIPAPSPVPRGLAPSDLTQSESYPAGALDNDYLGGSLAEERPPQQG